MAQDLELKRWLEAHHRRYLVVATKMDKLNQSDAQRTLAAIRKEVRRAPAVLGRHRPGSEGNLASDNENTPQHGNSARHRRRQRRRHPAKHPGTRSPPRSRRKRQLKPRHRQPRTANALSSRAERADRARSRQPCDRDNRGDRPDQGGGQRQGQRRKHGGRRYRQERLAHARPGRAERYEHPEAQPGGQRPGRRRRRRSAQTGADLQDPANPGRKERAHLLRRRARMPARWLRLPARARVQLSARPRRRLRLAFADPPLRSAHRRHHLRPDPPAQGRRALLRADQSRRHQLRAARGSAQQDLLRQPHAALSQRAPEARNRARRTSPAA